jgi:hypothetical protein
MESTTRAGSRLTGDPRLPHMSTLREQTAAKIRLEAFRRGDRVVITLNEGDDPQLMIVNSRIRPGATIGDAQITVRHPGTAPAYAVTAGQVADGLEIERACRACDDEAVGECIICDLPVCEEHCGSRDYDRYCQPPCAA